jgi:hypothetical protein
MISSAMINLPIEPADGPAWEKRNELKTLNTT